MNVSAASAPGSASTPPVTKVLVAIHGIGDQVGYATAQSVAGRLGAFLGCAMGIPLGRFYQTVDTQTGDTQTGDTRLVDKTIRPGPVLMSPGLDPRQLAGLGLAEVYWAAIARKVSEDRFTLEESKRWGRTITARLSASAAPGKELPLRERERIESVLDEIIETVLVLDRLTFLARKAGVLDFNLKVLLDSFVGDVQIVADFKGYREQILDAFDQVMSSSLKLVPAQGKGEIYLVAHSEGTVVAFLALLRALADPGKYDWIRQVKGFMTIGSPIEVHHLLWPHLWREAEEKLVPSEALGDLRIPWVNYMDWADPIAYPLTTTKQWLGTAKFAPHLCPEEVPFSRSYLPGKAHVDYWKDGRVFGHFLETVVKPAGAPENRFLRRPRSKPLAVVTGYVVPQLLILLLILGATYLVYRPLMSVIGSKNLTAVTVARDVLGLGLLLLGITAAARIPRLTNQRIWWVASAALLAVAMLGYATITCPAAQASLGTAFRKTTWLHSPPLERLATWSADLWGKNWACATRIPDGSDVSAAIAGTLAVAAVLTAICAVLASWKPAWIPRLLPALGLSAAAALVIVFFASLDKVEGEMWPLFLGGAAFFYLWWLATLLFDLSFVWQRFVRGAAVTDAIRRIVKEGEEPSAGDRVVSAVVTRGGTTS